MTARKHDRHARSSMSASCPRSVFDTKAPLWWGNTLLLFIETAMFGILVAIYFTVMMNTDAVPAAAMSIGCRSFTIRCPT